MPLQCKPTYEKFTRFVFDSLTKETRSKTDAFVMWYQSLAYITPLFGKIIKSTLYRFLEVWRKGPSVGK